MRLAREIRAQGARASMALKPATPIEPYEDLLPELDMVLHDDRRARLRRPEVPRPVPAQDPHGARALMAQARRRDLAPGRRRRLARDDRALRRGRCRRLRRGIGRLLRRRPRRHGARAEGEGRGSSAVTRPATVDDIHATRGRCPTSPSSAREQSRLPGRQQVVRLLPDPTPRRGRPGHGGALRRRDRPVGRLRGRQAGAAPGRPAAVLHHPALRRSPVGAAAGLPRRRGGPRRAGRDRRRRRGSPRPRPGVVRRGSRADLPLRRLVA